MANALLRPVGDQQVDLVWASSPTRQGTAHPVLVDPATEMADHELLRHVMDFYHTTFCNDPMAMKYLEGRHCFHP